MKGDPNRFYSHEEEEQRQRRNRETFLRNRRARSENESALGIVALVFSILIPPIGLVCGLYSMDTKCGKAGMIIGAIFTAMGVLGWALIIWSIKSGTS